MAAHLISQELEQALSTLNPRIASLLEQAVREAVALASQKARLGTPDARGYPVGYFEKTAGSFSSDPLTRLPPPSFHSPEPC